MIPLGVLASARVAASGFTTITDSFNRADSATTLGSTDTGQAWEIVGGTWGVMNGTMYKSAGGASLRAHAVVDWGLADMSVTVQIPTLGSVGGYPHLVGRFANEGNGYFLQLNPPPSALVRRVGGVNANMISNLGTTVAGDAMTLSIREQEGGTVLTVYRNGVQIGTYTDTTVGRPVGTRAGVFSFGLSTDARFDNFTVEAP